MKLEIDMPEHHYNNIIAFDSVSLGRVPYKGIIMYAINAIKRGKALEQEPTTKTCKTCRNYGSHNGVCDICKNYDCFTEPNKSEIPNSSTTLVSLDVYNQVAKERNIAIQQLHELGYDFGQKIEPTTTKNDLEVDCISRQQAIDAFPDLLPNIGYNKKAITEVLQELPSVTPQEPFINKPCVSSEVCEHDKNVVLNKIRAEIKQTSETVDGFLMHDGTKRTVLHILDKYKAESEKTDI